jgi:hypothetical protein
MAIDLLTDTGMALERQRFTWKDLVGKPLSKLDADAFSRIRLILMNGVELDALRQQQALLRLNRPAREAVAGLMRVEQHQATAINWMLAADHSPLETTIAFEQVAIEVTASVAQLEPDPAMAQGYRFGLLEDFDHLYRYAALLDRLEGKDANTILQGYTDIVPGRPTMLHHRASGDDLMEPYPSDAPLATKLHALTLVGGEYQTHDYYMTVGPQFADPVARQLYAEIASVESQHITQYGSMLNPEETPLEKLVLQQAAEVWNYQACAQQESDPRLRALWERFLDYELGQLQVAIGLFQSLERRDAAQVLGDGRLPPGIAFRSQRDFVRQVLATEVGLRKDGTRFVAEADESVRSMAWRNAMNAQGVASQVVASGYQWTPGGELNGDLARAGTSATV